MIIVVRIIVILLAVAGVTVISNMPKREQTVDVTEAAPVNVTVVTVLSPKMEAVEEEEETEEAEEEEKPRKKKGHGRKYRGPAKFGV